MTRFTLLLACAFAMLPMPAFAADSRVGAIEISGVFARATANASVPGAAYLRLRNTGATPDRLVAAATPAARTVELHTMVHEGQVMRMRALSAIDVPAGETVTLAPNARLHLMLIGLSAPLRAGESLALTLRFEKAGEVRIAVPIERAGAMAPTP